MPVKKMAIFYAATTSRELSDGPPDQRIASSSLEGLQLGNFY